MVSKSVKLLIQKKKQPKYHAIKSWYFWPHGGPYHADRYQAAQFEAPGQTLQSERP